MATIINEGIWTDPWVQSLPVVSKLLYIYLWTNDHRNLACLYEISLKTISNELEIPPKDIERGLERLYPKILYDGENNICWVKSFVRRQFLRYGHISPKIISGITKNLMGISPRGHPFVLEFLKVYSELNIHYPYTDENGKDITVLEPLPSNNNPVRNCKDIKKQLHNELFERFWVAYPKKVGKEKAREVWGRIGVTEELLSKMLKTIEVFSKTDQWKEKNGKYIPHPTTWLNQGRWDDEPPIVKNTW